jgi:hypothetical protein
MNFNQKMCLMFILLNIITILFCIFALPLFYCILGLIFPIISTISFIKVFIKETK